MSIETLDSVAREIAPPAALSLATLVSVSALDEVTGENKLKTVKEARKKNESTAR